MYKFIYLVSKLKGEDLNLDLVDSELQVRNVRCRESQQSVQVQGQDLCPGLSAGCIYAVGLYYSVSHLPQMPSPSPTNSDPGQMNRKISIRSTSPDPRQKSENKSLARKLLSKPDISQGY